MTILFIFILVKLRHINALGSWKRIVVILLVLTGVKMVIGLGRFVELMNYCFSMDLMKSLKILGNTILRKLMMDMEPVQQMIQFGINTHASLAGMWTISTPVVPTEPISIKFNFQKISNLLQ